MTENLKQVDLFGNKIPLCANCGYPCFPFIACICEYEYAKYYGLNPFEANWHVHLDEGDSFSAYTTYVIDQGYESHGRIKFYERYSAKIRVEEHTLKGREVDPQVSLIGYLFGGAAP